jgi:EAL domain-containing protein (putative c-di-GMP-specific phosphodiesterase class I)/DNA-binding NarL/FixJ family response regulator
VLIAEDDTAVREALSAVIDGEPSLELAAAVADGEAAIEAAARVQPNVAVLDVRMPRGGGAHAARGIAECSPGTRVVALSASEDRAAVLEMLEAGAVGYLVKGSSIGGIVESIEQAAQGHGSLSVEVTGNVIEELVDQLAAGRRRDDRRRRRSARIQKAIKDATALEIVFQPICVLGEESFVGVEALSRFRGPPRRTPDKWFAEAEEVGLRTDLELAAVARIVSELPQLPSDICLFLNASPATLATPEFRRLLTGNSPERVVVEVTEHAPVPDYERLNDSLRQLRLLGARLAIDDAGAGFASLQHILRLAPDFIKLDRSLISGIEQDRSQQALASGLISFADKIGATIIAEGVEREPEVMALTDLGVSLAQGFFLARPAPLPLPAGIHSRPLLTESSAGQEPGDRRTELSQGKRLQQVRVGLDGETRVRGQDAYGDDGKGRPQAAGSGR